MNDGRMVDLVRPIVVGGVGEWMGEWMGEWWVNGWVNRWVNGWVNGWVMDLVRPKESD